MRRFNYFTIRWAFTALVAAILLSTCTWKKEYPRANEICFDRDILPILQSNCAMQNGCHDDKSHAEGLNLSKWNTGIRLRVKPGNAKESGLYEVLVKTDPGDRMPPDPNPPLTQKQIDLIALWINQGAQYFTLCPEKCDTAQYTYSGFVKPLMDNYCTGCHRTGSTSGNINLDNHASVKSSALSGKLLGSIRHDAGYKAMPQNADKLSSCAIDRVDRWIKAGCPNN